MYNHEQITLCLIDDIKSVVDGLTAIEWADEHGITLVGSSANGEDGLELVKRVKPDLIITDIRMPKMDGLTMLRAILELNHSCKVILISGYTDFEYAKQAVQLGAFDFVVKPFTEEDITEVVLKAKLQIIQERSKLLKVQDMQIKLRESMPVLRQEYFALLVNHRTSWENAAKRWEFLKVDLDQQGFVVLLLEIDGFQESVADLSIHDVELIRFSLQNITEETIREHTRCMVFRAKANRFVAILNDSLTNANAIAESCCRNIEQFTKFTVSIGVGGRVEQVSELPDSYRQANQALTYHLFTEGNGAIGYEEIPKTDRQAPLALDRKDELLLALRSGNSDRATSILADISDTLHQMTPRPNPDYLLSLYQELAASTIRTFYELVPYSDIQPYVQSFKTLGGTSGVTLSGLEQQLLTLCQEGTELVRKNTLSEGQTIIYKSLDYLKSHLDREVTVAECAAHVHLSSSYYSSLFKKVTGMTLTQYVTAERIHKAKAMLVGGVPVQEVASAVGYEERRYFSDVFKKMTGMTPSEFRASYDPDAPNT
ncbi:response regulator [Paenibacillus agricola]|uniref:Response regulator n=1 Tax=Paenibacillus agricola TaxID=2716264 RepID=A0ABX0J8E5_9BACL|nr:response regulator [Paenibacillus agricola]NHN31660.1 response regulator [Paenibacillus agricola]